MRAYYNIGYEDFREEDFASHLEKGDLKVEQGNIVSAEIIGRKFLSNKGTAISGSILGSDGRTYGLNIGQNPIGTGHENYIPFLEEIGCRKVRGIFRLASLIDKSVIVLKNRAGWVRGYTTHKDFQNFNSFLL